MIDSVDVEANAAPDRSELQPDEQANHNQTADAPESPTDESPRLLSSPFDEHAVQIQQELWAEHLGRTVRFTNSIGMQFVLIPPGTFMMGTPQDEMKRANIETLHRVRITRPFWIGVYEVNAGGIRNGNGSQSELSLTRWQGQLQSTRFRNPSLSSRKR